MDVSELRQQYETDGFVVVRSFLSADELAQLNEQLDRYIREVLPTLPKTAAFFQDPDRPETLKQMQHMGADPHFNKLRTEGKWSELARALIGEEVEAMEPEWFNKPPGAEHPTPPHQDNFYFCFRPSNVLTMWLALDFVDEENGCLRYVVGSHRRGLRQHQATAVLGFSQGISDFSDADRQNERMVTLAPGDVVIHHGETIHRAEPNRSMNRHRRAFAMVFHGRSCQRDPQAFRQYQQAVEAQHQKLGLQKV